MDPIFVQKLIQFVDGYRTGNPKMYFFMKDCIFTRVYRENNGQFPYALQEMVNMFQMEMKNYGFQRSQVSKEEYKAFLGSIINKMDFKTIDLDTCQICKCLTENLGVYGPFEDLTSRQITFLTNKINQLKSGGGISHSAPLGGSFNSNVNNAHQLNSTNASQPNSNQEKKEMSPEEKDMKKAQQEAEDKRLNDMMYQYKISHPPQITNHGLGQFYNPFTLPNYIPNGVDRSIPFPVYKNDRNNYMRIKALIEEEISLANQELDYHKIDMARNHIEKAVYYLKNVIE